MRFRRSLLASIRRRLQPQVISGNVALINITAVAPRTQMKLPKALLQSGRDAGSPEQSECIPFGTVMFCKAESSLRAPTCCEYSSTASLGNGFQDHFRRVETKIGCAGSTPSDYLHCIRLSVAREARWVGGMRARGLPTCAMSGSRCPLQLYRQRRS